ncbi:hypothetical protein J6590_004037 [Homalodisca vitripennis]|nr:hypothetical protein J6590_004037 [Homalodisca vitripennis]
MIENVVKFLFDEYVICISNQMIDESLAMLQINPNIHDRLLSGAIVLMSLCYIGYCLVELYLPPPPPPPRPTNNPREIGAGDA